MVKTLAFNFRLTLLPSWGLVNIHTGIGIIRAEYVPNTEIHLQSGAYSYDFKILDDDIPAPGDFGCDDLVEPYVTAFNSNASCPTCFHNLPTVDFSAVLYMAALIPNQCGGAACLALVPADQVCQCGGSGPGDLDGYAVLNYVGEGSQGFNGNQTITGNLSVAGVSTFTGNVSIASGTVVINSVTTINKQIKHNVVSLVNSDDTVTWNLSHGNYADLTIMDDWTLSNPSNIAPGSYFLRITQGTGGGHALSYDSNFVFPGGTPPVLSPAEGAVDVLTFQNFGGSALYLTSHLNFAP